MINYFSKVEQKKEFRIILLIELRSNYFSDKKVERMYELHNIFIPIQFYFAQ